MTFSRILFFAGLAQLVLIVCTIALIGLIRIYRLGKPCRSHGGSVTSDIERFPAQASANIVVSSSREDVTFDALVADTKRGIAVVACNVESDQQGFNATIHGFMYEIVNGALGSVIGGGHLWIRAPEFWKSLVAIGGGADSLRRQGILRQRSWESGTTHTIEAPAAKFTNVPLIHDERRQ